MLAVSVSASLGVTFGLNAPCYGALTPGGTSATAMTRCDDTTYWLSARADLVYLNGYIQNGTVNIGYGRITSTTNGILPPGNLIDYHIGYHSGAGGSGTTKSK